MSDQEKEKLAQAAARATERFNSLKVEQKVERLKEIGILDEQGDLSEKYGGSDNPTPELRAASITS